MQAKLVLSGKEFQIAREATIGKHPTNTVVLANQGISRRHARIYYDDVKKSYFLEDLDSQNGTRLDGERVRKRERLDKLHVITLGNRFDLFFHYCKSPISVTEEDQTEEIKTGSVDAVVNKISATVIEDEFVEAPHLIFDNRVRLLNVEKFRQKEPLPKTRRKKTSPFVLSVKQLNKRFRLKVGRNIVGRTGISDINIPLETISRRHACISIKDGFVMLNDLYSTNHTFIGGKRITSMTEIKPNTPLRFGNVDAIIIVR